MNLPKYSFSTDDHQEYFFSSEGPKGRIKKVVLFSKIQTEPIIYNLAFGDQNPVTGLVSDSVVSNNRDRDIVLATVANTIHDFCNHYGNQFIYAKGSSASRTRLYQMSVAKFLDNISMDFDVYGIIDDIAVPFEKGTNYDAFLVRRK